jgi:thiol-disulfide isomerase/thioredoxin
MSLQEITTPEEYIAITRSAGWNVILCSAEWCKVCQEVKPKLIALAKVYEHVKFYVVDEAVEHADVDDVKKLPTVLVYKNGKPAIMHVGGDMTPIESLIKAM